MYLKTLSAFVLLLTLCGCVTRGIRPSEVHINKSKIYNAQYDKVWSAAINMIAEYNLPISTQERDSGIIVISELTYYPSWANEGTRGSVVGAADHVMKRQLNFNIFVAREGPERTRVQVNGNFSMQVRTGNMSQAFPYKYEWIQTYSNGSLERKIFNGINRQLEMSSVLQ